MSCSGATTANMTASQSTSIGTNPPQFNALTSDTHVVSLQIGGNDIGFTDILENCATVNPFGSPCKNKYDAGGVDQISARIKAAAPKVAAVIKGIQSRSPSARVLVVNYAAILPATGSGCWPQAPFAFADVPYLRAKEIELNSMLASAAASGGARLVDDYTASLGKDSCKSASCAGSSRWCPRTAAAPFHPNARGEAGIAVPVGAAAAGA